MTIVQMKYIVTLADVKSFAKAAAKLFVTQPTLSMQIAKAEDELGVLIFDRSRQPVIPTPIGEKIIEQARETLREASRIKEIADSGKGALDGEFKVGIIPTIAPYLLPYFLQSFLRANPKIKLILDELQTESIVERLRKGDLDAGILSTPLHYSDIKEEVIYYEPFLAYVSRGHPLFKKEKISAKELDINDIWLLKEGHCFREHVIKLCDIYSKPERKTALPLYFEGGSLETLMRLVEKNYGMTLIPHLTFLGLAGNNKKLARSFKKPVPYREISVVYHRSHLKERMINEMKKEIIGNLPTGLSRRKPNSLIEWKE